MTNSIVLSTDNTLISEVLFASCLKSNQYLLVTSGSPDFAGTVMEISKGEEDLRIRLLDQTSRMVENKLEFDETVSLTANREAFEKLMEIYDGDDLLSMLLMILNGSCPDCCELDTLIGCVIEIYETSIYGIEFILQKLLSANRASVGELLAQEIDFSEIV